MKLFSNEAGIHVGSAIGWISTSTGMMTLLMPFTIREAFEMKAVVTLSPEESKRLIAKAIVQLDVVKKAKVDGIIGLARCTSCAYVVEELLGKKIDKTSYRSGMVSPKGKKLAGLSKEIMPDLILQKGRVNKKLDRFSVVTEMKQGDVYLKGANALNYLEGVAGIYIGHPTAGTIGAVYGALVGKRVHLIIPIGLEKLISADIIDIHHRP